MAAAGKWKERRVEELYNSTEMITQLEITPVLRGSYKMQGPIDNTDDIQKNMVPLQAERRFGKSSMSRKGRTRAESGTCNVCSAPCSSCMHLNLGFMGSKPDEFSDKTCRVTVASQNSINEDDALTSFKVRADSLQNTTSEASNLVSVNSSHDSFSENAESKETVRCSDISNASEDVEMLSKFSSVGTSAENQLSSVPKCILDQRTFSNKYEGLKGVEGHDDNISSVSRANDASVEVGYHNKNVGGKNLSRGPAAASGLGMDGSGKGQISQKLDLSEVPSIKEANAGGISPKVQSPYSHPQSVNCPIGSISEGSLKIYPKSEAENSKDSGDPSDEVFKHSGQDEHDEKSSEMVQLHDMQEPPSQALSGNESDESEMVEHDVKVCDICGDAGREDLLAICSRCSDGAEHTYCMREMLQKVPEGEWLCEECKFAEETENQKQGSDAEGKRANKANSSTESSGKRRAENIEVASAIKRQAIETCTGSPKSSSPTRIAALSRDSSFKSLDKGKIRPAHQTSYGTHSNYDNLETARSPTTGPQLQPSKGVLSKSNSFSTFNSKPKVKLVDDVPQKAKGSKEHAYLDTKEGLARTVGKSMSFKYANLGRPNGSDSKVKLLSSKFPHVQDPKGLKQVKERSEFERKNLSKLDRSLMCSTTASLTVSTPKVDQKLTPRGDAVSLSSGNNNRESKVLQPDGKLSTLTKSASNLARNRVEIPVTSVGASSSSGICRSAEQKSNQVTPKDEPLSSSSWTVERPSGNVYGIPQDGLPWSVESTNHSEKTRESFVSRSRPTIMFGSKGVPCQKCKEVGHAAESCQIDSPQASGSDVSGTRNSREGMVKGNKLKAAIEAAMRKKPGFGKSKGLDQSDGLSVFSIDLNGERAPQSQLSASNKLKNLISVEGTQETQVLVSSSDSYKQTTTNSGKQLAIPSTDAVLPPRFGDSDSNVPPVAKQTMRDCPSHALVAISTLPKISPIPEHEYIWQGGFEVHGSGKLPELCGGIQAHLSTLASPKVLEVVKNFPERVPLNEVPRLSTWPVQFHDNGAKEDHIALYFFAKELESYERNYKGLVDRMIKNDFALKGNLNGVDLLIFPSNQLPENCQRWNMLFFLWGVFRGRRVNCSNASKKSCIPGLKPEHKDVSSDVPSQNQCSPKRTEKESKAPGNAYITANGDRINIVSSLEKMSLGLEANSEWQNSRVDSKFLPRTATSSVQLCPEEEHGLPKRGLEMGCKPSHQETGTFCGPNRGEKMQMLMEDSSSMKVLPVGNQEVGVVMRVGEEKMPDRKGSDGDPVELERHSEEDDQHIDRENTLERNINCWQTSHRKRPHLDLTETNTGTSAGTNNKMPWNEVNSVFVDGESVSKKLKTSFSGIYGCGSSRDRNSMGDGFASDIHDLGHSLIEKRDEKSCDGKVIPEELGTTERYFFPVDSHHAKAFPSGENSMLWKELSSEDEDQFHDVVPNLELALGAETKPPNKGILPFFVGMVEKNNNQEKPPDNKMVDKEEEEDVSASLSLSLSFPFPDKEQTVEPVSKTEQLLPERHHVNPSLLLFGGFPDK